MPQIGPEALLRSGLYLQNVVGLVVLYALFATKLVPIRWFERSASLLVKHLAFFFIPITVGLMDAGALLAHNGIAILSTLVVSAIPGFLLVGFVSQRLERATRPVRIATEATP